MEKTIELMAKYIEKLTGSCPLDLHDFNMDNGCSNICSERADEIYKCWIEYFEKALSIEKP